MLPGPNFYEEIAQKSDSVLCEVGTGKTGTQGAETPECPVFFRIADWGARTQDPLLHI
jgi:hypothetical protein